MNRKEKVVGRFAPSPTGPLHFGSLVAAVGSYCLARQAGGEWLLRMEDIDTPRVVPGAADTILRQLEGYGFSWDGDVLFQSSRFERYDEALLQLREKGLIFDCGCTRKEILASAPHPGEEGPRYPGTCRQGLPPGRQPRSQRIEVPDKLFCFSDAVFGGVEQHLADAVGDFVLKRADGIYAYQLAVVVDDIDYGVNQIVRGADLLSTTARQIYLTACFDRPQPAYIHLPIALGPDDEKLSKRHGDFGLAADSDRNASLLRTLRFLGQKVPVEIEQAPAGEILQWAVLNFDINAISRLSGRPDRV